MKLRLLQWNIWYKEPIDNIARQIKALDPDIVCLQELTVNGPANPSVNTAEYIQHELGFHSYFEKAQRIKDSYDIGNGIFSRFPLEKTSVTFIRQPEDNPADFAHEGRIYIETAVRIDGKPLTVGVVHSSYTHAFQETVAKQKETDNLLAIVRHNKERYVIAGDLNSLPDSYTIAQMGALFKNLGPAMSESTWTTKPFEEHGFKADRLRRRLDYVFGTQDVTVNSAKVVDTPYSDHLPILVEFSL